MINWVPFIIVVAVYSSGIVLMCAGLEWGDKKMLLLATLCLAVALSGGYLTETEDFNPSLHECEEEDIRVPVHGVSEKEAIKVLASFDCDFIENFECHKCLSFRDKTPEELAVDWCNKNPQDDVNCTCNSMQAKWVIGEVVVHECYYTHTGEAGITHFYYKNLPYNGSLIFIEDYVGGMLNGVARCSPAGEEYVCVSAVPKKAEVPSFEFDPSGKVAVFEPFSEGREINLNSFHYPPSAFDFSHPFLWIDGVVANESAGRSFIYVCLQGWINNSPDWMREEFCTVKEGEVWSVLYWVEEEPEIVVEMFGKNYTLQDDCVFHIDVDSFNEDIHSLEIDEVISDPPDAVPSRIVECYENHYLQNYPIASVVTYEYINCPGKPERLIDDNGMLVNCSEFTEIQTDTYTLLTDLKAHEEFCQNNVGAGWDFVDGYCNNPFTFDVTEKNFRRVFVFETISSSDSVLLELTDPNMVKVNYTMKPSESNLFVKNLSGLIFGHHSYKLIEVAE